MTLRDFERVSNELIRVKEENQELKKQLEEKIKIGVADHKYASKCEDKVITMENQQKEFIKWLKDNIDNLREIISDNRIENNISHLNYLIYKNNLYTEILQKYKSIIGDNKEDYFNKLTKERD